ncbi:muconate cycloisomerase family protein [Roseivivax sp. THAF197b]|uniref:muconate cycloisomerase family protein n=1 Tax=Roseivivax sp. THAF197b TaxID=2588299 RepID=UPI00126941D2|nr:muconate cycloisomerase family protein [Roseivivax sp. THAF197b]QFS85039.1 Muconate cycloisomerase 1 [Roseivivax sp. THAF197b]
MTKIDRIETTILDIPTIRGHVLSMTTMMLQSIVLVRVKFADGSVGYGEGTSIGGMSYGAESPESIKTAIDTYITPLILGRDGDQINVLIDMIDRGVKGNPIARCAVETALWDGLAKRLGVSIAKLFGGPVRTAMPVAWTLASGNAETDISEAHEMIGAKRHNIFKLKIGKRPVREDVAHVAAICDAVGDQASIRVDVNQAWSLADARWGLRGLQEIGVDLVEQPVGAGHIAQLRSLTDAYEIAVMADEALQGPVSAMKVAANRSADVFAVKIAQSGGLKRGNEVIAIGQASGIGLYAGTMLEAGIGTAAALQLFSTVPVLEWGTELFGPLLLRHEILARPIEYRDFNVHLPDGLGLGAEPDPEAVTQFSRDRSSSVHAVSAQT